MKKILMVTALLLVMANTVSANSMRVCNLDEVHYMKTDERKQSNEKNYLKYHVSGKALKFTVQDKSSFEAKLVDTTDDSKIYETKTGIRVVVYSNQKEIKLITDAMTAFLIDCRKIK